MEMGRIFVGAFCGLLAVALLLPFMALKSLLNVLPLLDFIAILSALFKIDATHAWYIHIGVGVILGGYFARAVTSLRPLPYPAAGAVLALVPWAIMMLTVMPLIGAGFAGLRWGWAAPAVMLGFEIVFGVCWGIGFALLGPKRAPAEAHAGRLPPAYPDLTEPGLRVSARFDATSIDVRVKEHAAQWTHDLAETLSALPGRRLLHR
jgi:hypothetical protein